MAHIQRIGTTCRLASKIVIAIFVCGVVVATLGCTDGGNDNVNADSAISARQCHMTAAAQRLDLHINCFWYRGGKTAQFLMPVSVISRPQSVGKTALLYIPGGPGNGLQSSAPSLSYWLDWYSESGVESDLVIFNPRGVPGSRPYWYCDEYERLSLSLLSENLTFENELEQAFNALKVCFSQYSLRLPATQQALAGGQENLQSFSSLNNAKDVLGILDSLGYRRAHLWGVSYGSRVALKAAQLKSELTAGVQITSLVLDSPYPFEQGRQSAWVQTQIGALALHRQWYSRLGLGSREEFDLLWEIVFKAMRANGGESGIQPDPLSIKLVIDNYYHNTIPEVGLERLPIFQNRTIPVVLNDHRLQSLLVYVLYDPNLLLHFYRALEEVRTLVQEQQNVQQTTVDGTLRQEGNQLKELQWVTESFISSSFSPNFSSLVFFATECNDNKRESDTQFQQAINANPSWTNELSASRLYDICSTALFKATKGIGEQAKLTIPSLILVGEMDPVTPVSWATALHNQAGARRGEEGGEEQHRSALIVVPNASHSVMYSGACSPQLISAWELATEPVPLNLLSSLGKTLPKGIDGYSTHERISFDRHFYETYCKDMMWR